MQISSLASPSSNSYWIKATDRRIPSHWKSATTRHLRFAVKTLKLRPEFCLYSLPGTNGFYRSLKMVNVPEHNKEPLLYFEQ